MDVTEKSRDITEYKHFINHMLNNRQWSGLEKKDIERWIGNFVDIADDVEMYYVYKLLANLIYFSENDMIDSLSNGIINYLHRDVILKEQIESGFTLSSKAIDNIIKKMIAGTCFTPLLDNDAPHESGNYIMRLIVQGGLAPVSQSVFAKEISKTGYERLVIVDDCLGTGQQLKAFWENQKLCIEEKDVLLRDFCEERKIEVCYLVLFGYEDNINALRTDLPDLSIYCVNKLGNKQRVFSDESYIWENSSERDQARDFFQKITREFGIAFLGYNGLDFAFIMHHTIPDWSLPLFWQERPEWKVLLRRKNSNG